MTRYLHTMYRITDPPRSRAFYEALGLEFRREMDIVRGGETEATNYFFAVPGQDEELELTFNHDGRTYELRRASTMARISALFSRADQALYESKNGPPPSGSSGVREPRRPKPSGGSSAIRLKLSGSES